MSEWSVNKWQRGLFGVAAAFLLVISLGAADSLAEINLVPLLWSVIFAAVALSRAAKPDSTQ